MSMLHVSCEPVIPLLTFTDSNPTNFPCAGNSLTFCLFFKEDLSESVLQTYLARSHALSVPENPRVKCMAVFVSPSAPGELLDSALISEAQETLFWTGPLGLQSEICVRFGVTSTPIFLVLRGYQEVRRVAEVPTNLKSILFECSFPLTYSTLAKKLGDGFTSDVIAAYHKVQQSHIDMDADGVSKLLEDMTLTYGLDLTPAKKWFKSHRFGPDRDDVIDPGDISLKQFTKRLRNYCLTEAQKEQDSVPKVDSTSDNGLLQTRLKTCEVQIQTLSKSLFERDVVISQLKQELERYNLELQELTKQVSPVKNTSLGTCTHIEYVSS